MHAIKNQNIKLNAIDNTEKQNIELTKLNIESSPQVTKNQNQVKAHLNSKSSNNNNNNKI